MSPSGIPFFIPLLLDSQLSVGLLSDTVQSNATPFAPLKEVKVKQLKLYVCGLQFIKHQRSRDAFQRCSLPLSSTLCMRRNEATLMRKLAGNLTPAGLSQIQSFPLGLSLNAHSQFR